MVPPSGGATATSTAVTARIDPNTVISGLAPTRSITKPLTSAIEIAPTEPTAVSSMAALSPRS